MSDKILFYIKENLPSDNRRVLQEDLINYVVQDMLMSGMSVNVSSVHEKLIQLDEKQHIVMFRDGTVAMTTHGEHHWGKI